MSDGDYDNLIRHDNQLVYPGSCEQSLDGYEHKSPKEKLQQLCLVGRSFMTQAFKFRAKS